MKRLWRKFRQALDQAIYEGRGEQILWLGGILIVVFWIMVGQLALWALPRRGAQSQMQALHKGGVQGLYRCQDVLSGA